MPTITTTKKPKPDSKKSFAFKERMRIGGEIAAALPQCMSQQAVATKLGISQQMVSRLERQALWKVRHLLLARREVVANALPVVASRENECR